MKWYKNELLQSNFFEEEFMGSDGSEDNCTTQKLRDDAGERLTLATELRCPERLENTHKLRKRRSFFFKCFPSYTFFCLFKTPLPKPTRILLTGNYRDDHHTPYCPRIDLESESQDD